MAKLKETWREKLISTTKRQNLPRIVEVNEKMSKSGAKAPALSLPR